MPVFEQAVGSFLLQKGIDASLPLTLRGQFNDFQVDVRLVEATVDPKAAACGIHIPGKNALSRPRTIRHRKKNDTSQLYYCVHDNDTSNADSERYPPVPSQHVHIGPAPPVFAADRRVPLLLAPTVSIVKHTPFYPTPFYPTPFFVGIIGAERVLWSEKSHICFVRVFDDATDRSLVYVYVL